MNDLCKDLPSQIKKFTNYVKLLEFEEKPDYYYLRGLITSILDERNIKIDLLKLSWIKSADINNIKNKLNRIKRDYSYPERSFKNISKNISQEKNKSQDNYSGKKINYKKNYIKQKNEDIFIFKDEAGFSTINYKINNENISGKINYPLTNKINFNEFSEKKYFYLIKGKNSSKFSHKNSNIIDKFYKKKDKLKQNQKILKAFLASMINKENILLNYN